MNRTDLALAMAMMSGLGFAALGSNVVRKREEPLRKVQTSEQDQAALAKAQAKRDRKAAKRAMG